MNILLILFGKILSFFINFLVIGRGSTWPGHIALIVNDKFSREILKNSKTKIVLIAGTNGKTTTSKLIRTILEGNGKKVLHNEEGANLENGLASTLIRGSNFLREIDYDYLIFESDENSLPLILKKINPHFLILLNLFRDQLDRYGEIDSIAKKWEYAVLKLKSTKIIANADDASIAYIALTSNLKTYFFGLDNYKQRLHSIPHGADSIYCPRCNNKLTFEFINFSHLGKWNCNKCKLSRPKTSLSSFSFYPLAGAYNKYNVLASVLFSKVVGINEKEIHKSLQGFSPAFGRQEKIEIDGKKVQLFLSKNPTSFNESLKTISDMGAKNILIVLNDKIPDGRDVSWIWDINLSSLKKFKKIFVSGDRVYDIALRIKYELENQNSKVKIYENLNTAIKKSLSETASKETLFILPTYSAMLEVRKILTGRKIL